MKEGGAVKPKKKPNYNSEEIQKEYIDHAVAVYQTCSSIRAAARELKISPMKLRKILITEEIYDNAMSREIITMYKSGIRVEEIAKEEGMTVSNVYSYLPYEKIVYKMDQKSVAAERQQRYRDRKNNKTKVDDALLEWLNDHPGIVADLRRRSGLK
ncbi:MAG: hypothetical protein SOW34_07070 [Oliverpabstia sp.]|nr:hypothetical protein [Oliverpabstia sp.]